MKRLFDMSTSTRPLLRPIHVNAVEPSRNWVGQQRCETCTDPGVIDGEPCTTRVVLIVEDDLWIQDIIGELLEDEGFEVVSSSDGVEGLQAAERLRPSLILLDVGLPRMSGEEFLEHLRSRPSSRPIPVVVISAKVLSQKIAGLADCVLRKPFDIGQLLDVAHAHTRLAATGPSVITSSSLTGL